MTFMTEEFQKDIEHVRSIMTPLLWRIVVLPRPEKTEDDGLVVSDESQQAQHWNTTIGCVVSLPPMAYTGSTKAHIDLSQEPNKPKEGDWVMFFSNASFRMELEPRQGHDPLRVLVLNDTDILAVVSDPDKVWCYL